VALSTELVDRVERLEALAPEWRALASRAFAGGPATWPCWQLAWWRVFGDASRSLRCVAVRDDERLVGLALVLARRRFDHHLVPFRRLELVGSGEDEADEICSEYLGVLADRSREDVVATAVVDALGRARAFDELVASSLLEGDPVIAPLSRALSRAGLDVSIRERTRAPYVELPASFGAYLDALPGPHRYLVRRSLRDFDAWAAGSARHRVARDIAQVREARGILERLHGERWAHREGGAFASPRFRAFHDAVMPALLDEGALDLEWLEVRDEPVAAVYNLVADGKIYFYQSGRSLAVPPRIRLGIVLHARAIERAIAEGMREYDFLGGTQRYKLELAPSTRSVVELRAVRPSWRERARVGTERAIEVARAARDRFFRGRAAT
jgi:CelD/BcsL family acetyltransferase involved in cellulose biosynthesis